MNKHILYVIFFSAVLTFSSKAQIGNEDIYCAPTGTMYTHPGATMAIFSSLINDAVGGVNHNGGGVVYLYNHTTGTKEVKDGPSAPAFTGNYNSGGAYVRFYDLVTDNTSTTATPSGTLINIDGGSGAINLRQEARVTNQHTFANGVIWTPRSQWKHAYIHYESSSLYSGYTLNNTTATGASRKFVDGYVARTAGTNFDFPVSDGIYSRFCGLRNPQTGRIYKAAYFAKNAKAGTSGISGSSASSGPMNGGITKVNATEFWDIDGTGSSQFMLSALNTVAGYSDWNTVTNFTGSPASQIVITAWDPWENLNIDVSPSNLNVDGLFTTNASPTSPDNGNSYGSGNPFSAYTWAISPIKIPLPLNLVSFIGKEQGCAAALSWTTTDEVNTKHFEIEQVIAGTAFSKIGIVAAQTNGNGRTYSFSATQPDGVAYYRLKMIDIDGQYTYSPIVPVSINCLAKDNYLSLYPNPVNYAEIVTLSFKTNYRGKGFVRITNALGQQLHQETLAINSGANIVKIPTNKFSSGIYFVSLVDADANVIGAVQKLIKN